MTRSRGWARRAMLTALAGGGLTAAGLGGPFAGGALGADAPVNSTTPGEGSTTPVTAPTTTTPTPATGATGTTPQPTNTSATSVPSSTPPASTPAPAAEPAPPVEVPTVVVQRRQRTTKSKNVNPNLSATPAKPLGGKAPTGAKGPTTPSGPSNVAPSPELVAAQAGALEAELATSAASVQALGFYRIPLFLLPIYRAAAIQYGVPWQILAAVNEICLLYTSPSPRDRQKSRMPSS